MSFLFTDLSTYIQHIPVTNSGIYLTKGSHKKEYFTCGNHTNEQKLQNKTQLLNGCVKCENQKISNDNLLSSKLIVNLSAYLHHIPKLTSGIYLMNGSNTYEYFTCGKFINLKLVNGNRNNTYTKIFNNTNILSSFLITDLSIYISHICYKYPGITLLHSSNKKDIFTCGNHNNLQCINDKTKISYDNCKLCYNRIINNQNMLSSILFTHMSTYIQHIPEIKSGLFHSKGSGCKEIFTCGIHINLQIISSKTHNSNGCKQCIVYKSEEMCRNIIEELTGRKFPKNRNIDWLVNPNTKCKLEIDCCNLKLKLGIEYNDHKEKYNKKQSDEHHLSVINRDKIKQQLCRDNNFLLLYVPTDYTFRDKQKMKEFMEQLLIDNGKQHLL